MKNKKNPSVKQLEATNKAYKLRQQSQNDNELAEKLNLSKVTTYTRLKQSNWTNPEILFIEYLSNPELKKKVDSLNILEV